MNIYEILDEIEQAYPQDIFPDTTPSERQDVMERYPGFIDRTSAAMGRHLANVIRERLARVDDESELEHPFSGAGEVEQLIQAARGLVEYRAHAGPLNFQLEKADHFIRTLFNVLESMGEAGSIRKIW